MDQETGVDGQAGVLCPGGIELARNEDFLFTWEAGSNSHSNVDVEGPATGFLGKVSRSFFKRSFGLFMVSSSIVAWGNLGGGMVDCCKWLLLQEVDEKIVCRNVKKTVARLEKMKKVWKNSFRLVPGSPLTQTHYFKIAGEWNFQCVECLRLKNKTKQKTLIKLSKANQASPVILSERFI